MATMTGPVRQQHALDFFYQRRDVRSYRPDKVDDATIRELLSAAVQTPIASHLEPWAFVVVQNRAVLKRYSVLAKSVAVAGAAKPFLVSGDANIFCDAGTLIVVCEKASTGAESRADGRVAADNITLAASAMELAASNVELALPVLNRPDVKQELGITDGMTAVAAVVVGVPRMVPIATPRKAPPVLKWMR